MTDFWHRLSRATDKQSDPVVQGTMNAVCAGLPSRFPKSKKLERVCDTLIDEHEKSIQNAVTGGGRKKGKQKKKKRKCRKSDSSIQKGLLAVCKKKEFCDAATG